MNALVRNKLVAALKSPATLRRTPQYRVCGLVVVLGMALGGQLARAAVPDMSSGHGITVTGWRWITSRTYEVDITTAAVAPSVVNGPHRVRVTLPGGYATSGTTHYPVLYLLHGGAGGSAAQWTSGGGDAEAITAGRPLITVMPDGGKVGWYTNWVDQKRAAQAWADFHVNQLIPWVDDNLRTIARKEGRAIAGLSMGGFGAIRYAQDHPELFAYAASFSGALDLGDAAVRTTVTEQAITNLLPSNGAFGPPFWPLDNVWNDTSPLHRADRLRGVAVALYAGAGINDFDILERTVGQTTDRMHFALAAAGVPHFYWMYGRPGPGMPYGCDGGHNFSCWNFAFHDVLPRMMDVLWHP